MKIEIGKIYITKTQGGYYSDWIVKPITDNKNGTYLCNCIKGKDLPSYNLDLPFQDYELIELSPVLKELYE